MFKDLNEAVDAIRSARSLEELQVLVNDPVASRESGGFADTPQQDRQTIGTVLYLSAGVLLIVEGLAAVLAYYSFWISVCCTVYWLWEIDIQGIVRSLIWAVGSAAVASFGAKTCNSLGAWFKKHQEPAWVTEFF
jgi:hypothetical protein